MIRSIRLIDTNVSSTSLVGIQLPIERVFVGSRWPAALALIANICMVLKEHSGRRMVLYGITSQ